ncbi:hypothetical protein GCM10023321_38480 [Pseudonocardia eucalypti]|uniref:DUF1990 domain-containing protein n=1 Tax=Pseudonocardia eucalypti TaxID=648755 RepID=A0ABP9Q9D1_9PSEU|nr:uncharacterized protein (UPF0548 family) [Pseudonocardia eucalypti]
MSDRLRRRYPSAEEARLTYPHAGRTRDLVFGDVSPPVAPEGYHLVRRTATLGHGDAAFARARERLWGWAAQRRAGAVIHPPDTPPAEGLTVLVAPGIGPLRLLVPCRVVWTVDEPDRVGFGYGTLPGHPVSGEEAFVARRDPSGEVRGTILAFSRPATWYTRMAGPAGRAVQRFATTQYLAALR